MNSVRSTEGVKPDARTLQLVNFFERVDRINAAYDVAAAEITGYTGRPICIDGCGRCCAYNSVLSTGLEAEYAVSWLLGQPALVKPVLDRIREWLTEPGQWSYKAGISPEAWQDLKGEFERAVYSRCALVDGTRCFFHLGRPWVCRAYGVSHMAGQDCPRPLAPMEDPVTRVIADPMDSRHPIRPMTDALLKEVKDVRLRREGFFVTMIFERLAAKELAGLMDDGKIPAVKLVYGLGARHALLWQEDFEREWNSRAADASIKEQSPLIEVGGKTMLGIGDLTGVKR